MAAFKFSNKDQTLTVYNLSSDTNELIGQEIALFLLIQDYLPTALILNPQRQKWVLR